MINLKEYAKKEFGQNFLKDEYYIDRIIQSMPDTADHVVEIGPGLGDLTKKLIQVKDVTAFEVDTRSCRYLQDMFAKEDGNHDFRLVEADVLKCWEESLVECTYDLVANLPYYIATNIILRALEDGNCKSILVMVQKEVALKFAAQAGEKEFSALSVLTQSVGNARVCFDVEPEAFEPPPKVVSSVLLIEKETDLTDRDFQRFLKVAFKQPRKTLMKNLSALYPKQELQTLFEAARIDPKLRPHQLVTPEYHRLYERLKGVDNGRFTKPKPKSTETKRSGE